MRAAFAMMPGSEPKIWTASGCSSAAMRRYPSERSLPCERPAQLTISEQTSPAPYRRPWRRNAWTLTPAIGARTTRVGISISQIFQLSRRFGCTRAMVQSRIRGGASRAALPQEGFFVKEVILTKEGYEKLKQEIDHLRTEKRKEVAERIRVAREFG